MNWFELRQGRLVAAAFFMVAPSIAMAQGSNASSAAEFTRMADHLKPGEWVWAPAVAPAGPVLVYVDLSRQLATIYRNGVRIGVTTVSSGKPGYTTPTGVFTILQKDAKHRSKKYNDAPMPFQERLTWDGVALHAGGLPGFPESHGCVHLPFAFSRDLFGITSLGATVVIEGDAANHTRSSDESLLAPFDAKGRPVGSELLTSNQYSWHPEIAPAGPMTIIISKSDQRVVVLRNGIEIGRSLARVNDDDVGTHVLNLVQSPGQAPRWTFVGLPGHPADAGRLLDEATINRLQVPRPFFEKVRAELRSGTTVLITQARVGSTPGKRLTVMDAIVPNL